MSDTSKRLQPHPAGLNAADFVQRYGGVYEHSPWIAATAHAAGLPAAADDPTLLAGALAAVVAAAPDAPKLALLKAHPELAGKLAVDGALTAESTAEQASARLDQCSPDEFARFTELNTRYAERFGFPFIIAVRGLDRAAILAAFERRIGNAVAVEFAEALAQVDRIAQLRLMALATDTTTRNQ